MQPNEPVVQSEVVAAAETPSSEVQDAPKQPSIWDRLFGRQRDASPEPSETSEDAPNPLTRKPLADLSPEELDQAFKSDERLRDYGHRLAQSEADKREAKRQREATEKAEADRRESIARKLDPSSPEFDPYGGADEQAKLKAEEQAASGFSEFIGNIGKQHDAATLDVIKDAVPAAEWNRILSLEGAGVGLDGRKLIVSEGLKALEKHWKAEGAREAEAKLQGDPIFRKKVFTEHRGEVEEPELVVGQAARGGDFMDQIFSDYQAAKGRKNGRRRSSE